jgi:RNA polymerase sigma factor (sigma-70 family)
MTVPTSVRAAGASDVDLLRGFAAGDVISGEEFVGRFQRRVFGAAIALLRDPGVAEDVSQEAFVRAWRHAAAYDPERGSVSAWLLRTTRNLAIDTLRRRRPEPVDAEVVASAFTAVGAGPSVEDTAATSVLADHVRAAMSRLPPEQARALWLAAFYGHTAQQIATSEGIPLGTAKSRIRRAMRTLRAEFTDPGDTAGTNEASSP